MLELISKQKNMTAFFYDEQFFMGRAIDINRENN